MPDISGFGRLSSALNRVADVGLGVIQEQKKKLYELERDKQFTDSVFEMDRRTNDFRRSLDQRTDYQNFGSDFDKVLNDFRAERTGQITIPEAKVAFDNYFDKNALQQKFEIGKAADAIQIADTKADVSSQIDELMLSGKKDEAFRLVRTYVDRLWTPQGATLVEDKIAHGVAMREITINLRGLVESGKYAEAMERVSNPENLKYEGSGGVEKALGLDEQESLIKYVDALERSRIQKIEYARNETSRVADEEIDALVAQNRETIGVAAAVFRDPRNGYADKMNRDVHMMWTRYFEQELSPGAGANKDLPMNDAESALYKKFFDGRTHNDRLSEETRAAIGNGSVRADWAMTNILGKLPMREKNMMNTTVSNVYTEIAASWDALIKKEDPGSRKRDELSRESEFANKQIMDFFSEPRTDAEALAFASKLKDRAIVQAMMAGKERDIRFSDISEFRDPLARAWGDDWTKARAFTSQETLNITGNMTGLLQERGLVVLQSARMGQGPGGRQLGPSTLPMFLVRGLNPADPQQEATVTYRPNPRTGAPELVYLNADNVWEPAPAPTQGKAFEATKTKAAYEAAGQTFASTAEFLDSIRANTPEGQPIRVGEPEIRAAASQLGTTFEVLRDAIRQLGYGITRGSVRR